MWAWYQVVASWAVYQNTVPNAKKSVVARRTTGWMRSPPSIHQQIATSIAARTVKIVWSSADSPHAATNGTRNRAGNGGKGISATRDAVTRGDRQDVLEECIAEARRGARDGIADGCLPLEEGGRLPHEMVVEAVDLRREVHAQRDDGEQDPHGDGEPAIHRCAGSPAHQGVVRVALCYAQIHLPRSCRSRFPVTGPVSGGYERGTGAPSRSTGMQGTLGAILIVLALGLALRLILAYLLPGSGFDCRPELIPILGGQPRRQRALRLLSSATSSTTTRPDTCTSCGSSAPSGTRSAASATSSRSRPSSPTSRSGTSSGR